MKRPSLPPAQLEWVKPPRQERSQQTLERLLEAAEGIVVAEGIDAVTVARVAREAGSSVGAFYARFADKDALVRCVFERFCDQAVATADAVLEPSRWRRFSFEQALETMLQFMMRVLAERRLLILALMHRAAHEPELKALGQQLHRRLTAALTGMLEAREIGLHHPEPAVALDMAVWMVLSLMESRALLGPDADPPVSDGAAPRETARMMARYLGVDEHDRDKRPESETGEGSYGAATGLEPRG